LLRYRFSHPAAKADSDGSQPPAAVSFSRLPAE
jgi:hypothetical protein